MNKGKTGWALVCLVGVVGCGGGGGGGDTKALNDLKEIGLAYHEYHHEQKKSLEQPLDLAANLSPATAKKLGEGQYVVITKVDLNNAFKTPNLVLGYEKDVPAKGGAVLMIDGTVRKMTAQEFQAAKKAQ